MTRKMIILFIFLSLLPVSGRAVAARTAVKDRPVTHSIDEKKLETAIHDTLNQRKYTWRMPRPEQQKTDSRENGFLRKSFKWIQSKLKGTMDTVKSWITNFIKWLEDLFPKNTKKNKPPDPKTGIDPTLLAAVLIGIVFVLLLFILATLAKQNKKTISDPVQTDTKTPDINDENVLADELTHQRWIDIAHDLTAKKEFRPAIRALYLGTLAFLADRHFISIARYKSNYDYKTELSRRLHTNPDIVSDFFDIVQTVDCVWYGLHHIDKQGFDRFLTIQNRITHFEN